jgi:hypothetical protein
MHADFLSENMYRPLGRSRCRWEHNIGMDPREIEWEYVDWIHLAKDMDQWWGSRKHGNELSSSIKGRELLD